MSIAIEYGFSLVGTGGNCTAYVCTLPLGTELMLTIDGDAYAPQGKEWEEGITVGWSRKDHDGDCVTGMSLAGAYDWVMGAIEEEHNLFVYRSRKVTR